MPVLECTCGMVMSVAAARPRATCIRCRGAKLRELFSGRTAAAYAVQRAEAAALITPSSGSSVEVARFDLALLPLPGCAQLT
jgi:hypothetical protein